MNTGRRQAVKHYMRERSGLCTALQQEGAHAVPLLHVPSTARDNANPRLYSSIRNDAKSRSEIASWHLTVGKRHVVVLFSDRLHV